MAHGPRGSVLCGAPHAMQVVFLSMYILSHLLALQTQLQCNGAWHGKAVDKGQIHSLWVGQPNRLAGRVHDESREATNKSTCMELELL